jgi:hypothetical protein
MRCQMKLRILITAGALAMLAHPNGSAAAEQSSAPAGETSSSAPVSTGSRQQEVIVTGRADLAPKVSAFVNQITNYDPDDSMGLARWLVRICPLISGLSDQDAEFVLARVSEIARKAGAPIAGEKCRPNLYILITANPAELLRGMERRNRLFTFADAPASLIDEFIALPRPVKIWYHTGVETPEGLPLTSFEFPELGKQSHGNVFQSNDAQVANIPTPTPHGTDPGMQTNPWANSSHIILNFVWDIHRVIVVVDQTRLAGVTRGQLADYVAMVGLAQLKADLQLGDTPTILTLFSGTPQAASAGMTDWDQAFLKSLYDTDQRIKKQRSQIAHNMVRVLAP